LTGFFDDLNILDRLKPPELLVGAPSVFVSEDLESALGLELVLEMPVPMGRAEVGAAWRMLENVCVIASVNTGVDGLAGYETISIW